MRPHLFKRRLSGWLVIVLIDAGLFLALPGDAAAEGRARELQLDVSLGGYSIGLIGAFRQSETGALSARRKELEELGVKVPERFRSDDDVPLSAIAGLSHRYDEAAQRIDLRVPDALRMPKIYDASPQPEAPAGAGRSATGAVLNYTLFGSSSGAQVYDFWRYPSLSASLDGRLFSSLGVLSQTGIVANRSLTADKADILRLDTSWSYSDPLTLLTYRAGDTISGGLPWTRPIRLGGLQIQRSFTLRPDLVTLPLPSIDGSAAVPSTVDVFVNGIRTVSQDVSSGPFRINNVPILSGNGNASVVIRDASGQRTETSLPFAVSSKLLRPGLTDFSAEIGMPRLQYGLRSSLYSEQPAGSGSVRYGLSDRITLMAHGEGAHGFGNAGGGAVIGLGSLGIVNAAGAGSWRNGATGGLAYLGFETRLGDISFFASSQRSFGDYHDLASATASPTALGTLGLNLPSHISAADPYGWSLLQLPPRAVERISIGIPAPLIGGGLNLGFAHLREAGGRTSRVVNASYSRPLPQGGSFYATVFADLAARGSAGVFAGLSFPFGGNITASTGFTRSGGAWALAADITKPIDQEPGSIGWRLRDVEGSSSQRYRSASVAYRGNYGQAEGGLSQTAGRIAGTAQLDGALVAAGGGLFLANRIDDAFAIARVGAADVDVLHENRVVARTGANGTALIPNLRSYQSNRISIDPRGLPVTALAETTQEIAAPPDRAGVVVDFAVRSAVNAAVVILLGRDGRLLPAGSRGAVQSGLRGVTTSAPDFVVGYDGRAFVEHLGADNEIRVRLADGECSARFPFAAQDGMQVTIGPIPCR